MELTQGELRVLAALCASGGGSREIAANLSISERTVRTHLYRICAKLGCANRLAAVLIALRDPRLRPICFPLLATVEATAYEVIHVGDYTAEERARLLTDCGRRGWRLHSVVADFAYLERSAS